MCNVRGRLRVVSSYPKSHHHPWTDCGARRRVNHFCLDHDALDLIEADLIAPAIVEPGRARRGVRGSPSPCASAPITPAIARTTAKQLSLFMRSLREANPPVDYPGVRPDPSWDNRHPFRSKCGRVLQPGTCSINGAMGVCANRPGSKPDICHRASLRCLA